MAGGAIPSPREFGGLRPVTAAGGFVQMTPTSAAGLTAIPTTAKAVLLQAETQDIRVRFDGTNPTGATNGFLLTKLTDLYFVAGIDLSKIKVLEAVSGGKLNVQYWE